MLICADCGAMALDIDGTFLIATRCRDPNLRRRALQVLWQLPRQEGIWQSTGAAAIAQRWIEVEEEGLGTIQCASDIPEHRRVADVKTSVDVDTLSARIQLTLSNANGDYTEPIVRQEYVHWQKQ